MLWERTVLPVLSYLQFCLKADLHYQSFCDYSKNFALGKFYVLKDL
jgi:hypothetical protein